VSSTAIAILEEPGDFVCAKLPSIALIGTNEPRRSAISSVLAEYPAIQVSEFSSYPTNIDTVSRLLAREFDIILVDLDSNPKVAIDLVEGIRSESANTVVPYTEEADPDLMTRCMRAGAREHLVLPVRQRTLDRIFARARIGISTDALPASKPGPQAIAAPEPDPPRTKPEPLVIAAPEPDPPRNNPGPQAIAAPEPDLPQNEPGPQGIAAPEPDLQRNNLGPQVIAALEPDLLRNKPGPQVVATPEPDLLRAKPEPQVIVASEPALPRNNASPVSAREPALVSVSRPAPVSAPPVQLEDEDLRQASKQESEHELGANDAALDIEPAAASREHVADRGFSLVSSSKLWPGGVVVEEIRFTPEPEPLATLAKDEGSLHKLTAVGTGTNGRSAAAAQWATFFSGASVAPPVSIRAVEPRESIEPVQETRAIEPDQEIRSLSFHSDLAELGDEDPDRKKWVRIGAAGFALLVLLLFVGPRLFTGAKHTLAAQSAQISPAANDPEPATKTAKPSPSISLNGRHPSATADTRQASMTQSAANVDEAIWPKADSETASATSAPPQVDSTLMNNQLASPPRIPQDVKVRRKEAAPPSVGFDAANPEELGDDGVVGSVPGDQARPTVKVLPPSPVDIPVKVAEELLVYKTLPTYPRSAWNRYISGKVVLEAIVSATGSVESLKVVSGPKVFQQAAMDAVKTWRYKPYVVNGRLVRVQTTVTLNFDPYKH
jgi:TonB family protein